MKKIKLIIVSKKKLVCLLLAAKLLLILLFFVLFSVSNHTTDIILDPSNITIVIDAGHGGVDGGATVNDLSEKEVNLSIAKKLKTYLVQKDYKVIMTREEDVSLDGLDNTSQSRHQRDLNARTNIINNSNAHLFVSIHVNCNLKKPSTNGSIVFYSNKLSNNRNFAYSLQKSLNSMEINGQKRTIHDPQEARYYILEHSSIPGALVETAFISNSEERELLTTDDFTQQLALSIGYGIERYLYKYDNVFISK